MTDLCIAQFGRLALYFPVYFAERRGFFEDAGIESVTYLDTRDDAAIYLSLVTGEAALGIVDPVFTVDENQEFEGTVACTLVDQVPLVLAGRQDLAVSDGPLSGCRIGTYGAFTTSHMIAQHAFGDRNEILPYDHATLAAAVESRDIDGAVLFREELSPELLERRPLDGLFSRIAFKGLCTSHFFTDEGLVGAIKMAMDRSLKLIHSSSEIAVQGFADMFPDMHDPEIVFSRYQACWPKEAGIRADEWSEAVKLWHEVFPDRFRNRHPSFLQSKPEELLLGILANKTYCRDMPSRIPDLMRLLHAAVHEHRPMSFVVFWGAADKSQLDRHDRQTLDHLEGLFAALRDHGVAVAVKLLLCDAHAMTNGYSPDVVRSYAAQVEAEAQSRHIEIVWLSQLWQRWGLTSEDIKARAKDVHVNPSRSGLTPDDRLVAQAKKHYHGDDPEFGAAVYLTMRSSEAPYLADCYLDHIFVSYSDRSVEPFLPKLPIIYTWSLRKKVSEAPWFMDPPAE